MPGGSKKGGGLEVKKSAYGAPYKMKGNPFQRNFGIGETESPDAVTPVKQGGFLEGLKNIDLKGAAQAALAQLPGGKIADSEKTEYERDENGKLIMGEDGKPIPKKDETSKTKPYTAGDLIGDITGFLNPEEKEKGPDDPGYIKEIKGGTEDIEKSLVTMKGTPAKKKK